jgi:hypothetical protein
MAEGGWPDNPQQAWDPAVREKYPEAIPSTAPSTTVPASPASPAVDWTWPSFGRGAGLVATSALGVPGDVLTSVNKGIDAAREIPAVNALLPHIPDVGPQIPIPTTAYIRDQFGMQGPQNRAERLLDTGGRALGAGAVSRLLPGAGGGAMLSGAAGTMAAGEAEEYFPDSVALQLLASAAGGLGSTTIARQLLFGGVRQLGQNVMGVGNALVRDYIGRAIGAGISHMTGLPEILSTEVGGLAGLLSHSAGRSIARNLFSRSGMRGAAAGAIGGMSEGLNTYGQSQMWPDNPLGPPVMNPPIP